MILRDEVRPSRRSGVIDEKTWRVIVVILEELRLQEKFPSIQNKDSRTPSSRMFGKSRFVVNLDCRHQCGLALPASLAARDNGMANLSLGGLNTQTRIGVILRGIYRQRPPDLAF